MINTSLFPYSSFPIRLDHKNEGRICWFKDDIDLQKYLNRNKIDKRTIQIQTLNDESIQPNSKRKNKVRQATGTANYGSSDSVSKRKSSVDSRRNSVRNSKTKKC